MTESYTQQEVEEMIQSYTPEEQDLMRDLLEDDDELEDNS